MILERNYPLKPVASSFGDFISHVYVARVDRHPEPTFLGSTFVDFCGTIRCRKAKERLISLLQHMAVTSDSQQTVF